MRTLGTILLTGAMIFGGCGSAKTSEVASKPAGQIKTPEQIAATYNASMMTLIKRAEERALRYSMEVQKGANKVNEGTQKIKDGLKDDAKKYKTVLQNYQDKVDAYLERQEDPNYSPEKEDNTREQNEK